LKRVLSKAGCNTVFKSGSKLQNVLCSQNKTQPSQTKKKGVYKLTCPWSPSAIYIGQTAGLIETRMAEHRKAAEKGNWSHSGITQHKEHCHLPVDKNKKKRGFDLKVQEALEIKKNHSWPKRGLNEDYGAHMKTNHCLKNFDLYRKLGGRGIFVKRSL
jgi:hypothetical protein